MNNEPSTILSFLEIAGYVDTIVLVGMLLYAIYLWARGIFPALIRLGSGLSKRRIAIFARSDQFNSLKQLLMDSKLFRERNIRSISIEQDLGRAEDTTVYLVYWPDWEKNIDKIVEQKPDKCALIVYAPVDKGRISEDRMTLLNSKRHSTVVNFRGRLLNDIVASMITTSYEA